MDKRIRQATQDDIDVLATLEALSFSEPWTKEGLLSLLEGTGSRVVVAEKENQIVGYGAYTSVLDEGMVANICVHPEMRNQGIGQALLREIILEGENQGLLTLFLEVRVSNAPAIKIYENEGFMNVGTRKNFYRKPIEDALIYKKELGKELENETASH